MKEAGQPAAITLHSSWRGIVGGFGGAAVVTVIAGVAIASVGWRPVPTVIGTIGAALLAVVVFDFPIATTFDEDGVERRPVGRRHRVPYDHIRQLDAHPTRRRWASSASVAWWRRWGGAGTCSSTSPRAVVEFAALYDLLERFAPELADLDLTPPEEANPTWLYRRRRWRAHEAAQ